MKELKEAANDALTAGVTIGYTTLLGLKVIGSAAVRAGCVLAASGLRSIADGAGAINRKLESPDTASFDAASFKKSARKKIAADFSRYLEALNRDRPKELTDEALELMQTQQAADLITAVKKAGANRLKRQLLQNIDAYLPEEKEKAKPLVLEAINEVVDDFEKTIV